MLPALIAILALAQGPAGPAGVRENPLARAALDAFAKKCVQCHGPDVPHPKAGFGYVTDLTRLVASQKYVVPGNLSKSELWSEIQEGDMPPDEARAGPLTPEETEAVRLWIVGGAPALNLADTGTGEGPAPRAAPGSEIRLTAASDSASAPTPEPRSLLVRLVALIGRFHVLVVHFPIALLSAAALAEAWELRRRSVAIPTSVRLSLALGALGAVVAAGLGWVHALDGFAGALSSPTSITGLHRWIGTAVGVAAPVVALLSERDVRRGGRTIFVRWSVFALAIGVGVAAHFGGLLTHGPGYFNP